MSVCSSLELNAIQLQEFNIMLVKIENKECYMLRTADITHWIPEFNEDTVRPYGFSVVQTY